MTDLNFQIDCGSHVDLGHAPPAAAPSGQPSDQAEKLSATYDAARPSKEYDTYWQYADAMDANAANSQHVRHRLAHRCRYEAGNNGYTDGMLRTLTNDLIGRGPTLRMQSGSEGFNRMVEREWQRWVTASLWQIALWQLGHAKTQDGESFGIIRRNPRIDHPVQIKVENYETEQVQDQLGGLSDPQNVDGIRFDQWNNPRDYRLLNRHPGSQGIGADPFGASRIPADLVLHYFFPRRPQQQRGVVESASTLNLGAASRRFRSANLSKAEKEAYWTLFLKSNSPPPFGSDGRSGFPVMSQFEASHGMVTQLPSTADPVQLRAEHPGPQYDTFNNQLVTEQARGYGMPHSKASGDYSNVNFASGRLALLSYYDELDFQRLLCELQVIRPLFSFWFDLAIVAFGWLGGRPENVARGAKEQNWEWPPHPTADVQAQSNADDKNLRNGSVSLPALQKKRGQDPEDMAIEAAEYYGMDVDEYKQLQLAQVMTGSGAAMQAATEAEETTDQAAAANSGTNSEPVPIAAGGRLGEFTSNGHH